MARRFTTIPGIGRCTVVLEGSQSDTRHRARLVFQVATGRVYLVTNPVSSPSPAPVTSLPTAELLERLQAYTWWLPLGPVLDEHDDD